MSDIIIIFLIGGLIIAAEEIAWKKKYLWDEYQRKFIHITFGVFMAAWPWLLSWTQIKALAILGIIFGFIYQRFSILKGVEAIRRNGYGHMTHPLAVFVAAMLTQQKVIFCLAILHMALADGLAAVFGKRFGSNWRYKVFGQLKTIIGSMTFWLTSLIILGVGLLFIRDLVSFNDYVSLLIFLPPILTLLENLGLAGLDNLLVSVAVIIALKLVT